MTNSSFQPLKIITSILTLGMLTACMGTSNGGQPTSQTRPSTQRMADNVLSAICSGQPEEAVRLLGMEPLASPTDQFFTAVALEESGRPAHARQLYARLMQSGSQDRVQIRCGGNVLADGTIAEEAAARLVTVSKNLALLDANLRPVQQLHAGLPSASKQTKTSGGSNSFVSSGPAVPVTAPGSQSPFGQWFAHLASYMSLENAQKNRSTLEALFPALSGIIDQWEVDTGGRRAIRLGIRVQNRADAQNLCQAVKSQGKYCAVIDTST